MDICKRFVLLVFVFSFCLIAFCGIYDSSASAAGAGTRTLTPAETRALIGDTIPAKYYDGSQYVDFTFTYATTFSVSSVLCESSCLPSVGDTVLVYSQNGQVSISGDNSFIQVDLQPQYSFYDTDLIQQYIGVSSGSSISSSAYASPVWRWYLSTQGDKYFYNDLDTLAGSGSRSCFYTSMSNSTRFSFVDAVYSAQSTFSGYSYRALFYGNSAASGHVYLAVSCPTVSDSSSMASGTGGVTTAVTGGTGDINVSVDVDMTETNSLLGSIIDAIEGLLSGIAGLFVPDSEFMLQWLDDMHDMLHDHFGSFVDSMLIIDEVFGAVHGDTANSQYNDVYNDGVSIGLPRDMSVTGYGVTFTASASDWRMPLIPDGFSGVLALFKDFQCILYTLMFINMINNKLHHYLSPQDGT